MKTKWIHEELLLVIYFLIFSAICSFLLFYTNYAPGMKIFLSMAIFHLSFPVLTLAFRWYTPFKIWLFLLPLSVFMVFPDWFLSAVLQVLVFPEDGFPKIGTVAGYMAGLWVIPLFFCVYTGIKLEERSVSILGAVFWVAITALLIFGTSEATMWTLGSWYAQNVKTWNHIAYYVLVPEMVLGVTAYLAYQGFSSAPFFIQWGINFFVMVLYLGNLGFFYLLVEKIL